MGGCGLDMLVVRYGLWLTCGQVRVGGHQVLAFLLAAVLQVPGGELELRWRHLPGGGDGGGGAPGWRESDRGARVQVLRRLRDVAAKHKSDL